MSKPKTYEVTKEHFDIFSEEVHRLWELWGLTSIRFELSHEDLNSPDVGASCSRHPIQHAARIVLNTEWNVEVSESRLRDYARHETIHALLGELGSLACCRFVTEDEVDTAEHLVLNRLNGLLPR